MQVVFPYGDEEGRRTRSQKPAPHKALLGEESAVLRIATFQLTPVALECAPSNSTLQPTSCRGRPESYTSRAP